MELSEVQLAPLTTVGVPQGLTPRAWQLAQNYCKRLFNLTKHTIAVTIRYDDDHKSSRVYTRQYPIRHATAVDRDLNNIPVKFTDRYIYPVSPWPLGMSTISVTCGYGAITDIPDIPDRELPEDLKYAIGELERTMLERETQVSDRQSYSGDLGGESYISAVYRSAIPGELKGILINYRNISL